MPSPIKVTKPVDREVALRHCLPLISGKVSGTPPDCWISVKNTTTGCCTRWPVINGAFKALVRLSVGVNEILLRTTDKDATQIQLSYEPSEMLHYVRPIYIQCSDSDGRFQAPDGCDNSLQSAQRRICLGSLLIQTFTADKLQEHGLGHVTFRLETDRQGEPVCHVFKTSLTLEAARGMTGNELWSHFARELSESSLWNSRCKWYAFMSFTRYNLPDGEPTPKKHQDILKYTVGHTALGGGGLALFGTGNLHTWAEQLDEIPYKFSDTKKVDRKLLMDDSAYREFYWANYSTGLGASLHELGHTFDLAHTPTGIMARGFDDLHKVFTVQGTGRLTNKKSQQTRTSGESARTNVFVETSFMVQQKSCTQTLIVENYDGSVTIETTTDYLDGQRSLKSDSIPSSEAGDWSQLSGFSSRSSSVVSLPVDRPCHLPKTPPGGAVVTPTFHETPTGDGKAHWYRSSAVLLRYHKWFNSNSVISSEASPTYTRGKIAACHGLRLVELRDIQEGVVFHHWEFLSEDPPATFQLRRAEIEGLLPGAAKCTLVTEDDRGNVMRKDINFAELDC